MGFAEHLAGLLKGDRDARAVQYESSWHSWGLLSDIAGGIDRILNDAGLGAGATVGLVIRERPWSVGGFYALLSTKRAALMIVGRQPEAALADDIRRLKPAAVIADDEDWARPGVVEAAREAGSLGIALAHEAAQPVRVVPGLEKPGPGPHHALPEGCCVTLLTSGTTGPAKRIPVFYAELDKRLAAAGRASSGVAINALPLHTMGGVFGIVDAVVRSRPISILERFDVRNWAALIAEHKPKRGGAPPAVLRMILDADIPKEQLASIRIWMGASAPLDRKVADEIERRYGFQCLQGWGSTEMLGSVTGWTDEDVTQWSREKAASVGRAWKGVKLRIVDPESAAPMGVDEIGRIEVWRRDFAGDGWMTTNDLGRIDADGFLFIAGRLDDVIIRGGLKVSPKDVEDLLLAHPGIDDAVVVGIDDERVGQVPVAAVVHSKDGPRPDEATLLAALRERLPAYKLPVRIVAIDAVPRNAMMKVERRTLKKQLDAGF